MATWNALTGVPTDDGSPSAAVGTTRMGEESLIYDAASYREMAKIKGHAGPVHAVSFSHDSQRLVTAAEDGTFRECVDVPGGKPLTTIGKQGDSALKCLIHSPDGGYVVVGSSDGTLTAWNPLNGKPLFRGKLHGSAVRCLGFTPDGSRLATASADRSLEDPGSGSVGANC